MLTQFFAAESSDLLDSEDFFFSYLDGSSYFKPNCYIIANSEHSSEKTDFLNTFGFYDWYYFFHGFAALDWYRNIRYMPPNRNYSKVFITFNNLSTEKRSYRLNLVARLLEKKLDGHISLNFDDEQIKAEIFNPNSLLSKPSKHIILKELMGYPRLTIDTVDQHGALSADDNLATLTQGLFHIVTETVFYDSKLHLTEKIFKPIVARRPFILAAAPGNLAYLKSYGFLTFDRWIDESYDLETDPDQRIIKIIAEIERICQMTPEAINTMFNDMQSILDYNFNWFYNGFKRHIVNELVDNFQECLIKHNAGRDASFINYVDYSRINFQEIKNRLAQ
jgi:ribosomal protein L23